MRKLFVGISLFVALTVGLVLMPSSAEAATHSVVRNQYFTSRPHAGAKTCMSKWVSLAKGDHEWAEFNSGSGVDPIYWTRLHQKIPHTGKYWLTVCIYAVTGSKIYNYKIWSTIADAHWYSNLTTHYFWLNSGHYDWGTQIYTTHF